MREQNTKRKNNLEFGQRWQPVENYSYLKPTLGRETINMGGKMNMTGTIARGPDILPPLKTYLHPSATWGEFRGLIWELSMKPFHHFWGPKVIAIDPFSLPFGKMLPIY